MVRLSPSLSWCAALLLMVAARASAHPLPDVPVRTSFYADGRCIVRVEVDPRCFNDDPYQGPYLFKSDLDALAPAARDGLLVKAAELTRTWLEYSFDPAPAAAADFQLAFTSLKRAPLAKPDDPVMITAEWATRVPPGAAGWSIRATPQAKLAVVFRNLYEDRLLKRFGVLFPGEKSFSQEIASLATAPVSESQDEEVVSGDGGGHEEEKTDPASATGPPAQATGRPGWAWWAGAGAFVAGWWLLRQREKRGS